jgi:hypothetical protein
MSDGDFPPAHELTTVSDDELHEMVRNGGITDAAVRDELHRRQPDLAWIDYLKDASYKVDTEQAGGHPNAMRLQLAPESDRTNALRAAYDALLAHVLGDPAPLRNRPTLTMEQWAERAGISLGTLKSYVSRGQAPSRVGFDPATGRAAWDAEVAEAWVALRVGRGRRDRQRH